MGLHSGSPPGLERQKPRSKNIHQRKSILHSLDCSSLKQHNPSSKGILPQESNLPSKLFTAFNFEIRIQHY